MALTAQQIETLAARKGVRRIAVMNFLGSLGYAGSKSGELRNMYDDARSYKWNSATQNAIARGIELYFKS
jgi:hypothetical protein